MRDVDRTGDSGTKRCTRTSAIATPIAPTTNSQRQLSVVDDHAGEHEPEPAADAEHRGEQADPDLHARGRELVADDPEAQRKDGAGRAGDDAERDQRPDVGGGGAADAADEERAERDHEQPLLPEPVAELAEDRRQHRGGEQEARSSTQVTQVVDASSSRWSSGSAGTTIVCWRAYAVAASVRIPRVSP